MSPSLREQVLQDWSVNPEGKSRVLLAWFRLAQLCRRGRTPLPRPVEKAIDRSYRSLTAWFLAMELHPDVEAGPSLRLFHANGIVVNPSVVLGARCTLRVNTVLGAKDEQPDGTAISPRFGDDVDVGASATVIGDVEIGAGAVIGAGSVVVKDVPPGEVVAGNPACPVRRATDVGSR